MTTPLGLVIEYLETHHPTTQQGRLQAVTGAPLVVFLRTQVGCLWRLREDLPVPVVCELAKLAGREPPARSPIESTTPPERLEPMIRALRKADPSATARHHLLRRDPKTSRWDLGCADSSATANGTGAFIADVYTFVSAPKTGGTGTGSAPGRQRSK